MAKQTQSKEKAKPQGFDLTTHHRDPKTGQVVHKTPYKLVIDRGTAKYERPPGSGLWYSADGSLIKNTSKKAAPVLEEKAQELEEDLNVDFMVDDIETEDLDAE